MSKDTYPPSACCVRLARDDGSNPNADPESDEGSRVAGGVGWGSLRGEVLVRKSRAWSGPQAPLTLGGARVWDSGMWEGEGKAGG